MTEPTGREIAAMTISLAAGVAILLYAYRLGLESGFTQTNIVIGGAGGLIVLVSAGFIWYLPRYRAAEGSV